MGADCSADHSLVFTKIRDRLVACKKTEQKFNVERLNLRKLSGLELRKQYQIKIPIRYAGLKNLYDSEDANRAWENMKVNIKISDKASIGLYEWKQHKP